MEYVRYSSGQYLFDRCIAGIFLAIKLLFRAVIYCPLLITGYFVALKTLSPKDSVILWIALTLLVAFTFYALLFLFKGMLIAFKSRQNSLWIPLFLICTLYTCGVPIWLMHDVIEKCMLHLSKDAGKTVTWLFSCGYAIYIYTRYNFLTDIAPKFIYPLYNLGISLALNILRGQKSR